jgi:hypothetical protein
MKSLNQTGASHIVALLGLAVIVVAGVVGYRVMSANQSDEPTVSISDSTTSEPDAIKSKADARQADAALDSTSIDSGVNPGQLDEDINSLN